MFRNALQRQSPAFLFQRATGNVRKMSLLVHRGDGYSRWSSLGVLPRHHQHHQHHHQQQQQQQQQRFYTPMTKEEEEAEKDRVSKLSGFKREQELRKLNREIMKLNMLKGINTGELYTVRGRYKMLLSDYGLPMMAWYGAVWVSSGILVFGALTVGGLDAIAVLQQADYYTGFDWSSRVDPSLGMLGITVVINEMLEPVRLPFVVFTVKPVMDRFFPPKV